MRIRTTIYYCPDCRASIVAEQIFVSEMNPCGHSFITQKCDCGRMMKHLTIWSGNSLPIGNRVELIKTAQKICTPLTIKA